jgi:hypothetical protein
MDSVDKSVDDIFMNQLRYEVSQGVSLVGLSQNYVVDQTLLLTDGTYHIHPTTFPILFSESQFPPNPGPLLELLLVELDLVNIHHLLACLHQLSDLHDSLLLLH